MATPRDVRRLALMTLFQLDARGGGDLEDVRDSLTTAEGIEDEIPPPFVDGAEPFKERDRARAFELAQEAWEHREACDVEMRELAPDWPTHRLSAIDRSILRIGHREMVSGRTPPKVAVNEAVELAKWFGGEKSPSFINGLLGKVLKRVQGEALAEREGEAKPEASPAGDGPGAPAG